MPLISSFRQFGRAPGEASRVVKQDGVTYVVGVRRDQVEPSGGCLIGFPVWAYTRLRWQMRGTHEWSVENNENEAHRPRRRARRVEASRHKVRGHDVRRGRVSRLRSSADQ